MAELVPIAAGAVPEPLVEKYAYPATATAATVVESAVRRNAFLYKSFRNVRYLRSQEGGLLRRGSRPTVDRPGGPVRHHPSGWTEVDPSAVGSGPLRLADNFSVDFATAFRTAKGQPRRGTVGQLPLGA